jgi:hypothetical protein
MADDSGNNLKLSSGCSERNYSSAHWYFFTAHPVFRRSTKKAFKIPSLCWCYRWCILRSFSAKWKFKLCCLLQISERKYSLKWKNGKVDALHDQPKLSYQTIEGINNILTQMDGRTNKSKCALLQRNSGSYTLNLRRTLQFLWRFETHAKQN